MCLFLKKNELFDNKYVLTYFAVFCHVYMSSQFESVVKCAITYEICEYHSCGFVNSNFSRLSFGNGDILYNLQQIAMVALFAFIYE